ncbi:MAG: hypothetical protein AABY98_00175 [Candidatus Deferrimicrobiota bacterium]
MKPFPAACAVAAILVLQLPVSAAAFRKEAGAAPGKAARNFF